MPPSSETPRRHFLQLLGATGLVVACGGNKGGASEATGDIPAGNVSGVAVGTLHAVSGHPVVIARDAGGLYAMSTICTHAQCDMTSDGTIGNDGMYCSCHGSKFDAQGQVLAGPASAAVRHFAVEVAADGTITIHAGTTVSVATRVTVA
jgi:nitrite reductase/ring-hydroxylating ferredoxin subunit